MADAARRGVALDHALGLIDGMRMDLDGGRFETLDDLRFYTYRVASVVGVWMSERAGVRDEAVLERAAALGHAMQLTNILRDVGEDWERGRLYLPTAVLDRHGLRPSDVGEMAAGARPVDDRFRAVMAELMLTAEREYERAFDAIPALPSGHRLPVAVAAEVYRGIHGALRRQGLDPFARRARTGALRKALLAARATWRLRRAEARWRRRASAHAPSPSAPSRAVPSRAAPSRGAPSRGARSRVAVSRGPLRGAMARVWGLLAVLLLVLAPRASAAQAGVGELRDLTARAVEDGAFVDSGFAVIRRLRATGGADPAVLLAYEGSLRLLQAKHGWWPPSRLGAAHHGLALLDSAVALRPDGAEVRYLRLASERGLPGIFGRGDDARADAVALARVLPDAALPEELRAAIAAFLLRPGVLVGPGADSLRTVLEEATDGG